MKGLNDGEKDGIAGVGLLNFPMKESLKKVGGNHHHKYTLRILEFRILQILCNKWLGMIVIPIHSLFTGLNVHPWC